MNEEVFDRHQPFAGDAELLQCWHKKEARRHRKAVKTMQCAFRSSMEQEANSPPEAQVEFVLRVARKAPGALDLCVVSKWMRQEDVACLLDDAARTFLTSEGANP